MQNLKFFRENYKNDTMIASNTRKPISFELDHLIFRCSYKLLGKSLKVLGDELGIAKLTEEKGGYNQHFTPNSTLPDIEYEYNKQDVLITLYAVVDCFKNSNYYTDVNSIDRMITATSLTRLENEIDGVKNYSVAVKKRGDDLTFLRRIVEGGTDDSYGIEAAKLAGVPQAVIKRAHSILSDLEEGKASEGMQVVKNDVNNPFTEERGFSSLISDEITNDLKKLDVTTLTPIEALNILNDYVKRAKEL